MSTPTNTYMQMENGLRLIPTQDPIIRVPNLPDGYWGRINLYADMFTKYFWLSEIEPPTIPEPYFGDSLFVKKQERVMRMYNHLDRNMGVALSGEKGGGKTVEAVRMAMESGMPVLRVDSAYCGEMFNDFIVGLPDNVSYCSMSLKRYIHHPKMTMPTHP